MRRATLAFVAMLGCEPTTTDRNLLPTCMVDAGTWAGLTLDAEEASNLADMVTTAEASELAAWFGEETALRIVRSRPFVLDPVSELILALDPETVDLLADEAFETWCQLDDGRQSCCVAIERDGLGEESSGVLFDDAAAFAVLGWANAGTHEELVSVCGVGDGIARGIRAARPVRTIYDLDQVGWVGPENLARILGDEACASEPSAVALWCELEPELCELR